MGTLRLTIKEIITLRDDRNYYIDQGYDYDTAQQRAYDHLYASRKGARTWI